MGRPKGFKREEVLDNAIQLFWRKGFADTSLQDLEKATGVNKSGLYSEFKDKDDLFVECLKHYGKTSTVMEVLTKQPLGRRNLENFLIAGQRCSQTKGCFYANTIREFSITPIKAKNQVLNHLALVKEAVHQNVVALVGTKNASAVTEVIVTFSSGIALRFNAGEIQGLELLVQCFLDSILSKKKTDKTADLKDSIVR